MAPNESDSNNEFFDDSPPPSPADELPAEEIVASATTSADSVTSDPVNAPDTSAPRAESARSPASPLTVLTSTRRASGRRSTLGVVGVALLLLAVLSGSVLAANGLASAATLAPQAQLWSVGQAGSRQLSRATNFTATETPVPCNCSSQHTTYAPPPYLGQVVVVSISKQQLWAYQNGQLEMTSLVTTGMPQLPTPIGTFHIMMKESNVWFYSPWPPGSPYYYTPEHIDYAMLFLGGGFYLHNAPWRETFGPGTNVPHTEPDGSQATGSHGCVNMPTGAAAQLYGWIGIGATVVIQY